MKQNKINPQRRRDIGNILMYSEAPTASLDNYIHDKISKITINSIIAYFGILLTVVIWEIYRPVVIEESFKNQMKIKIYEQDLKYKAKFDSLQNHVVKEMHVEGYIN